MSLRGSEATKQSRRLVHIQSARALCSINYGAAFVPMALSAPGVYYSLWRIAASHDFAHNPPPHAAIETPNGGRIKTAAGRAIHDGL